MSTISLPTSCLLDKSVVREALRGLVRETLGTPLPLERVPLPLCDCPGIVISWLSKVIEEARLGFLS